MGDYELAAPGPGKTAPRLLQDLLDYDPRRPREGKNLLVDPAPVLRPDKLTPLRSLPRDCYHRLWRKDTQSRVPGVDETPTPDSKYVSASYCDRCLCHFDVIVDYTQRPDRQAPCQLGSEYPLHHFRHLNSKTQADYPNKYDNYKETHRFVCTAPSCPVVAEVRISPPRLNKEYLAYLEDPAKIFRRGQKTIAENPGRYEEGARPSLPSEVLSVFRQYLNDALNKDPSLVKKIAVRNKKFSLAFAGECDDLLRYLEFTFYQQPKSEGESLDTEDFWILPTVSPLEEDISKKTNRQFIEDVMCELAQRIIDRPLEEQKKTMARITYQPLPALKDLQKIFGFVDYPKLHRVRDPSELEHPHYASLGACGDFADNLISFSYIRQCECDPKNKPYYLECLSGIGEGRKSSELEEQVVMALSMGENTLTDIENAYRFLTLEPDEDYNEDYIIGLYQSRIESAPRQKEQARECLLLIGKAMNSTKIQEVANDRALTVEEAYSYLGISADTSSDSIQASAAVLVEEGDRKKVVQAVRAVANHRNELQLHVIANDLEGDNANSDLKLAEAYKRLQIEDFDASEESVLTYYLSLSQNAPPGSKASYDEALRVIAKGRNSSYLMTKLNDPNAVIAPQRGTADQPVGLDNIGNTCYLNSLLQYYYTVKAVRDVVMKFEDYRMPLNTESMLKKRVGGRAVVPGEIMKAQRFVEELQTLFQNLKSASTLSVKPTQDLAELTLFSTATEANFRRASISSPGPAPPSLGQLGDGPIYGPQLPPPPPAPTFPPPPIPIRSFSTSSDHDIEMVDRPSQGHAEHDDGSSDATLIDLDTLGPTDIVQDGFIKISDDNVHEEPITVPVIQGNIVAQVAAKVDQVYGVDEQNDQSMTNGQILTPPSESEFDQPGFDKPPPVPPRKPAPIQTYAPSEDSLRAQKLYFGAQQDVTEVIGNVMFRLQCAIKPTSIDPKFGEQIDLIRETFYGANAVYLKKADAYDVKVEDWANVIVFPGSNGSRDIYEALDVVFDEQVVEINNTNTTQYASINKLPPVLQIQIQRTAFDPVTQQASKNQNEIVFEETIYLDRYMDSDKVLQRRKDAWKWKTRMRQIEARRNALQNTKPGIPVIEALGGVGNYLRSVEEEELEDVPVNGALSEALEERANEISHELENIADELSNLKKKLQDQFTDLREHRYRLQAVFIHRGSTSYGHYWIYIYDFPRDIWREYNDERVTVVNDRKKIFEQSGPHGATPYYLVYVRDDDKDDLVDAVCREIEEVVPPTTVDNLNEDGEWPTDFNDEAVDMGDDNEHVEYAELPGSNAPNYAELPGSIPAEYAQSSNVKMPVAIDLTKEDAEAGKDWDKIPMSQPYDPDKPWGR